MQSDDLLSGHMYCSGWGAFNNKNEKTDLNTDALLAATVVTLTTDCMYQPPHSPLNYHSVNTGLFVLTLLFFQVENLCL